MKALFLGSLFAVGMAGVARADGIDHLLKRLAAATSSEERTELVGSELFRACDPRIATAFKRLLSDKKDREALFVAWYLAKQGDQAALKILNQNFYQYECSSYEWSYVLPLFGMYDYRPAVPNLVDSLESASGNVIDGAMTALRLFYPGAPQFDSAADAQVYFRNKLKALSQRPERDAGTSATSAAESPSRAPER